MAYPNKAQKTCGPLCPFCQELVVGAYVLDDRHSEYYFTDIFIPMGQVSFMKTGYVHKVLKPKGDNLVGIDTINLLNEDEFSKYLIDMYTDIEIDVDGIAIKKKIELDSDTIMSTFGPLEGMI